MSDCLSDFGVFEGWNRDIWHISGIMMDLQAGLRIHLWKKEMYLLRLGFTKFPYVLLDQKFRHTDQTSADSTVRILSGFTVRCSVHQNLKFSVGRVFECLDFESELDFDRQTPHSEPGQNPDSAVRRRLIQIRRVKCIFSSKALYSCYQKRNRLPDRYRYSESTKNHSGSNGFALILPQNIHSLSRFHR